MKFELNKIIPTRVKPEDYIISAALKEAVQLALLFDQPLLLTGDPGTGKTRLADKMAWVLSQDNSAGLAPFSESVLRFNTKTTSVAKDLFYQYDAISHFQYTNTAKQKENKTTRDFIKLTALGKAMAATHGLTEEAILNGRTDGERSEAHSSIVLIDEIDKAPRDFTNDLLNEIEEKTFTIQELNNQQVNRNATNNARILIIMTSNSEKNLPDAFLRRCIFYHIPVPKGEHLQKILLSHLPSGSSSSVPQTNATSQNKELALYPWLKDLIELFEDIKNQATHKPPATAELVAFVKLLANEPNHATLDKGNLVQKMKNNLSVFIKTRQDWEKINKFLNAKIDQSKAENSAINDNNL